MPHPLGYSFSLLLKSWLGCNLACFSGGWAARSIRAAIGTDVGMTGRNGQNCIARFRRIRPAMVHCRCRTQHVSGQTLMIAVVVLRVLAVTVIVVGAGQELQESGWHPFGAKHEREVRLGAARHVTGRDQGTCEHDCRQQQRNSGASGIRGTHIGANIPDSRGLGMGRNPEMRRENPASRASWYLCCEFSGDTT